MENGNDFVEYLSTMNNAKSENLNALAEAQVSNKYYNEIMVERKLGKYIVENIKNGINKCYIITGHAGDGKTSILIQVLKELNLLANGEKLKISKTISDENINLFYVKDMSELNSKNQKALLLEALHAPTLNKTSILISNTGPLLKVFTEMFSSNDEEKKDYIEDLLLKNLDVNNEKEISIDNFNFQLINIARIENISFVKDIINKICSKNLWEKCFICENNEKCPMYFNYKCVNENKDRVSSFIETYYRWLAENNKRITIRQMIAQISYSFTGNIKCSNIKLFDNMKYNKFNFNFANLFFGYRGIQEIPEANQIKAIELIKSLQLDSKSLKEDYSIFVKNSFSMFTSDLEQILSTIWSDFSKHFYCNNASYESDSIEKQHNIRKAIRRFYLMYGDSYDNVSHLYNELYGEMFVKYMESTNDKQTFRKLKYINDIIFEAIYIKNLGIPPKDNSTLYLTLTRHDNNFQNVLLLLGKADKENLKVIQVERNNCFEDTNQLFNLELSINNGQDTFKLDLPILMHFASVVSGEISTEINPSLSHGLIELNSILLKQFRNSNSKDKLNLIVNTLGGNKEFTIEFEENKIYI